MELDEPVSCPDLESDRVMLAQVEQELGAQAQLISPVKKPPAKLPPQKAQFCSCFQHNQHPVINL